MNKYINAFKRYILIMTIFGFLGIGFFGCTVSEGVYLQVASRIFSDYGNESTQALVRVKNIDIEDLSSANGYYLTYHLKSLNEEPMKYDNPRTELPEINKGETQDILIQVDSPEKQGEYIVEVDIVKEGHYWLSEKGIKQAKGKLIVKNDALPMYLAEITTQLRQITLKEGTFQEIPISVKNKGTLDWASQGENPVNVSFHILSKNSSIIRWDNPRFSFDSTLAKDSDKEMLIKLDGNLFPNKGEYIIEIDLVHEGRAWFSEQGSPTLHIPVKIE